MKVLVLHSWGMGDMIMATPMIRTLAYNGYKVDLVTFSNINKIILQGNDFIDNIFVVDSKWKLLRFFKQYDYLVATAGTNPKKVKLANYFIQAKKFFVLPQQKDIHRIDVNLNTISSLVDKLYKNPYIFLQKTNNITKYLAKDKKNIGFAIGSGAKQKFKRWDKYKELIKKLDGNKLIFIGPDEVELEEEFSSIDATIVKEDILDTIYLISKLDLLVGNDNGLMHIGYATDINTVGIFGMTNEKETGNYSHGTVVCMPMSCRPCFDSSTDFLGCDDYQCLYQISTNKVLKECQKYLS